MSTGLWDTASLHTTSVIILYQWVNRLEWPRAVMYGNELVILVIFRQTCISVAAHIMHKLSIWKKNHGIAHRLESSGCLSGKSKSVWDTSSDPLGIHVTTSQVKCGVNQLCTEGGVCDLYSSKQDIHSLIVGSCWPSVADGGQHCLNDESCSLGRQQSKLCEPSW